jgi:hypothetical protein
MEPEQVGQSPAERFCQLTPPGKKAVAVLNGLLPAAGIDMIGAALLKSRKRSRKSARPPP